MDHVLRATYYSRQRIEYFLEGLLSAKNLVGENPSLFWKNVSFLNRQRGGASQAEMLTILHRLILKHFGFGVSDCGGNAKTFIYIDDVACTGNRIHRDLEGWIENEAPDGAQLHIITIAMHSGIMDYTNRLIANKIKESGKSIRKCWWRSVAVENRKDHRDVSDVLWPANIPNDQHVQKYVASMNRKPLLRKEGNTGTLGLFSSEAGRSILEQHFLTAGVRIKQECQNLSEKNRPLGYVHLETLGFGTLIVTYRNCPNNAPLALWVGSPWRPLFPRKTNSQTELDRIMEAFRRQWH